MEASVFTLKQQLQHFEDARKLVLSNATYYPQVIGGILPIIFPASAQVELRRWAADFLAETFASPVVSIQQKESLSLIVLEALKALIEDPQQDSAVVKSIVQTAASIYPVVFRWIINNPYDGTTWERMVAIKTRILRMWDSAVPGVRICCIKFAQRVVLVQTMGPDSDSRHGGPLEVSLAMVPQNHPLIPPRNLEAEASGLLDRMLGVFQDHISDAIIIDATLNSLSLLIRSRPHISNKILNVILNFNPLKQANSPMIPKSRVMIKSMEKTTRSLLIHILKREPQNPLAGRIQQHVERLLRSRTEIFDDAVRKRGPPEPVEPADSTKRQKIGQMVPYSYGNRLHVPPLTPGLHTLGELYTITADEGLINFDVRQLSEDLVVKISVTILQRIDAETLDQAIEGIQERYKVISAQPDPLSPGIAPLGVDDDDDYEPDLFATEDTEQILNKLDGAPAEDNTDIAPDMTLGSFNLPSPSPLIPNDVVQFGQRTISRVFSVMQTLDDSGKKSKAGVNRLAASAFDRDAWVTIITRLATRASACLEETSTGIKIESKEGSNSSLSDTIRETLYLYVLEDFRKRIDIAVSWLCEEWYNDRIQQKMIQGALVHYEKWVLRVLDGILPYLDAKDKVLTRFLSEIPGLTLEMLERVKGLCRDPLKVNLSLTSLLYLVMMRPPVREMALDAVEDVWNTYDDAKPMAAKYLTKYRPGFLERHATEEKPGGSDVKPNSVVSPV